MTDEQFQRWKDFALRMARTCYPATMRAPSRKWIVDRVEEFIDQMEDDRERITDWDSSWPEPPGSTYRSFECVSDRMSEFEWDNLPWRVQKLEHDEKFEEFEEAIDRWFAPSQRAGHAMFDLPGYIVFRLERTGVLVTDLGLCTFSDEARFFSYRRMTLNREPDYGRHLAAIAIEGG